MSTWHQRQAMARNKIELWDPFQWTVVTDPPEWCLSTMRWPTEEEANACLKELKDRGVEHCYILPPGGGK